MTLASCSRVAYAASTRNATMRAQTWWSSCARSALAKPLRVETYAHLPAPRASR